MGKYSTQGLSNCSRVVSPEVTHQVIHWRIQGPKINNIMINKIITKNFPPITFDPRKYRHLKRRIIIRHSFYLVFHVV